MSEKAADGGSSAWLLPTCERWGRSYWLVASCWAKYDYHGELGNQLVAGGRAFSLLLTLSHTLSPSVFPILLSLHHSVFQTNTSFLKLSLSSSIMDHITLNTEKIIIKEPILFETLVFRDISGFCLMICAKTYPNARTHLPFLQVHNP